MSNTKPIGLFDSGIGGTSIWKEVHSLLPNENTIYLADSKNAPYGKKTKEEIIDLCFKNVDFLLQKNCKLIVVACNTATTNAIKEMRAKYHIPFIGIEPAIKPAATLSETKTIGILATKGTLTSELFNRQLENYRNVRIMEQIGHGLVELIEDGKIQSGEMRKLLISYLNPMIEAGIDYLVLGCSHYPYLIPEIKKIIPDSIKIIDSGLAVAKQTKSILEQHQIVNTQNTKGTTVFYSNSDAAVLKSILGFNKNVLELDF
ncbi:glutamate racemase [Flavobacterium columnare]|uniref:Glutamate racemase n=2 Tax=Flavobacterium columnare TaxID=996 RepID=G8X7M3_FLACA|nr:glutamate racemase [Flavobacterium columnare]AEW85736.1 glutamate racemase [Flavobacterium columnare ATCC 49512]AMO20804.1 glutamate racemase [Flavobacterium columnare]ANO47325.1 glutamate racemase [Flavobacterium columnare]APT22015.1 glutamate racemase [Flavobacterium columnare]AUX18799.1 glutamate racemase [Flavobacterium columnare]